MSETITYEEAATILGIVPTSVYQLVSMGKLHPIKVPGSHKKRIKKGEVEQYKSKSGQATMIVNQNALPYADSSSFPPAIPIGELLASLNAGFMAISHDHERIAEHYKETVSPIVNHAISAPERAFIDEMSRVMQTVLNNLIIIIKTVDKEAITPEILISGMMKEVDLPESFKQKLIEMGHEMMEAEQVTAAA